MFAGDVLKFHPKSTWMGSANWTQAARRHIEFGLWSSDPDLEPHNYEYLLSLLTFSEPQGAAAIGPEPELVSADGTTTPSASTSPRAPRRVRRRVRTGPVLTSADRCGELCRQRSVNLRCIFGHTRVELVNVDATVTDQGKRPHRRPHRRTLPNSSLLSSRRPLRGPGLRPAASAPRRRSS